MMFKMLISLIAAMDENGLIGYENKLPWDLPSEWDYFVEATRDKPKIMGRKTSESIKPPMPGSIIMTRNKNYKAKGCIVVNSREDAVNSAKGSNEAMVIGGAEIYESFLPIADRLYVTRVHGAFKGDTYFPEFDENKWVKITEKFFEEDSKNRCSYTTMVLSRLERELQK